MLPNIYVHVCVGKLIFAASDMLVGVLIHKVLPALAPLWSLRQLLSPIFLPVCVYYMIFESEGERFYVCE